MQSCIRTLARKTRPGGDFGVEAYLPSVVILSVFSLLSIVLAT